MKKKLSVIILLGIIITLNSHADIKSWYNIRKRQKQALAEMKNEAREERLLERYIAAMHQQDLLRITIRELGQKVEQDKQDIQYKQYINLKTDKKKASWKAFGNCVATPITPFSKKPKKCAKNIRNSKELGNALNNYKENMGEYKSDFKDLVKKRAELEYELKLLKSEIVDIENKYKRKYHKHPFLLMNNPDRIQDPQFRNVVSSLVQQNNDSLDTLKSDLEDEIDGFGASIRQVEGEQLEELQRMNREIYNAAYNGIDFAHTMRLSRTLRDHNLEVSNYCPRPMLSNFSRLDSDMDSVIDSTSGLATRRAPISRSLENVYIDPRLLGPYIEPFHLNPLGFYNLRKMVNFSGRSIQGLENSYWQFVPAYLRPNPAVFGTNLDHWPPPGMWLDFLKASGAFLPEQFEAIHPELQELGRIQLPDRRTMNNENEQTETEEESQSLNTDSDGSHLTLDDDSVIDFSDPSIMGTGQISSSQQQTPPQSGAPDRHSNGSQNVLDTAVTLTSAPAGNVAVGQPNSQASQLSIAFSNSTLNPLAQQAMPPANQQLPTMNFNHLALEYDRQDTFNIQKVALQNAVRYWKDHPSEDTDPHHWHIQHRENNNYPKLEKPVVVVGETKGDINKLLAPIIKNGIAKIDPNRPFKYINTATGEEVDLDFFQANINSLPKKVIKIPNLILTPNPTAEMILLGNSIYGGPHDSESLYLINDILRKQENQENRAINFVIGQQEINLITKEKEQNFYSKPMNLSKVSEENAKKLLKNLISRGLAKASYATNGMLFVNAAITPEILNFIERKEGNGISPSLRDAIAAFRSPNFSAQENRLHAATLSTYLNTFLSQISGEDNYSDLLKTNGPNSWLFGPKGPFAENVNQPVPGLLMGVGKVANGGDIGAPLNNVQNIFGFNPSSDNYPASAVFKPTPDGPAKLDVEVLFGQQN